MLHIFYSYTVEYKKSNIDQSGELRTRDFNKFFGLDGFVYGCWNNFGLCDRNLLQTPYDIKT